MAQTDIPPIQIMEKNKYKSPINKIIGDMLPDIISKIDLNYQNQPKNILIYWPEVIGKKLASFTEAYLFENGVLFVKVKSSTLYSILVQNEKIRLLKLMQEKFSRKTIRDIKFKIG